MHENFCLYNNIVCKVCKEPIMKDELEEHLKEHEIENANLIKNKNLIYVPTITNNIINPIPNFDEKSKINFLIT